jgi:hypothetical protein
MEITITEDGLTLNGGNIIVTLDKRTLSQICDRIKADDTPDFLIKERSLVINNVTLLFSQQEFIEFKEFVMDYEEDK